MVNYDGRNELRFQYTTTLNSRAFVHKHTIDFDPEIGDGMTLPVNFVTVDIVTPDSSEITLAQMVDEYVALLLPFYRPASTEWQFVEWWRYGVEPSQDAVFMGVYDITEPGTAPSGTDLEAQQTTITFRTGNGGVMRHQLMENIIAGNGVQTFPTTLSIVNSLAAYLLGGGHVFRARDNSRPIATIKLGIGQNEAMAKRRFRS